MATGDLCTVGAVKELVEIRADSTNDDPFIQRLVTAVSRAFKEYLSRDIFAATYDELYEGTGTSKLMLSAGPVLAVSLVEIGSPPTVRSALTVNRDFVWTQGGLIILLGGVFPMNAPHYVRVTYNAGYAACPADIAEKAAKVAALRYKEAGRIGQTSKVIGGETVNFDTKDIPSDVRLALDSYKRVAQVTATPYVAA